MAKGTVIGLLAMILILQAVTAASVGIPAAYDLLELESPEIVPDQGPAACTAAKNRALSQVQEDLVADARVGDCRSREEPNGTFATVVVVHGVYWRRSSNEFVSSGGAMTCPVQVALELEHTSMTGASCY